MRTKIGIVYESITGQVRRIIVPDHDSQLEAHRVVNDDEVFHIEAYTGASINEIIQRRKMLP